MSAQPGAIRLALIRHGPTDWNAVKRIQGHSDIPLSEAGIAHLRTLRVPAELAARDCYVSPLRRARQSAALLGRGEARVAPALREMSWGEWEGQILKPLRRRLGDEMRANEARGLDFRPPGGESPREVQARLLDWLAALAGRGNDACAVTHKGIIRCLYSLASGWQMVGDCPLDFDWSCAWQWQIDASGQPLAQQQAIPLRRHGDSTGR